MPQQMRDKITLIILSIIVFTICVIFAFESARETVYQQQIISDIDKIERRIDQIQINHWTTKDQNNFIKTQIQKDTFIEDRLTRIFDRLRIIEFNLKLKTDGNKTK